MSIESQQLKDMGISFAMGDTEKLLPFTMLCVEEFEIIHATVGSPNDSLGQLWSKTLDISIGKGITYTLRYFGKSRQIHTIFHSQDVCFAFPLTVTVISEHEPEGEEHIDGCSYYPGQVWEKDENGWDYILDNNGDPWYEGDFECNCEYVQDSYKEFSLDGKDSTDLTPVSDYLKEIEIL